MYRKKIQCPYATSTQNFHISIAAVYTTLKQQNRMPFISKAISKSTCGGLVFPKVPL